MRQYISNSKKWFCDQTKQSGLRRLIDKIKNDEEVLANAIVSAKVLPYSYWGVMQLTSHSRF